VREDNKIGDLNILLGPKLYEADWQQLTDEGYLARVKCIEVQCRMSDLFFREYVKLTLGGGKKHTKRTKALLHILNPTKVAATTYLVSKHLHQGHKVRPSL
jgi:DNA excision repair protein ERCC-3